MPGKKRKETKKAPGSKKRPKLCEETALNRPKEYRQWSEQSMSGALKAVTEGMGVNRAAEEFGIPKTTLKDRVSGRVQHGSKSGKTPYLTRAEEEELVEYLISCSKVGYPKRRDDVIGIVHKTLRNKVKGSVENFKGKGGGHALCNDGPS